MSDGRPLGVVLVTIGAILFGLYSVLIGLAAFGLSGLIGDDANMILSLVIFGIGIGQFAAAYGLFTSQEWAWNVAMGVFGLDALIRVYGVVDSGIGMFGLFGLTLNLAILAYVFSMKDYYVETGTPSLAR